MKMMKMMKELKKRHHARDSSARQPSETKEEKR